MAPTQQQQRSFVLFAMLAGTFGALSGVVGKLSVTSDVALEWYLRVVCFAANGLCTAEMWRYYLKALSLGPTPTCQILNTGANFAVSALFGYAVFHEAINAMWLLGAMLVVLGLGITATDPGVPATN